MRRPFGELEARKSTKTKKIVAWRARYNGPDGNRYTRQFGDRMAAEAWLVDERRIVDRNEWLPPDRRDTVVDRPTLNQWAAEYVDDRTLAPGTLRNYTRTLRVHIEPTIGKMYLDAITVADVSAWYARVKREARARAKVAKRTSGDGSGEAAQAYKFLSSVFKGAVARGLIDASPARVVGAGRHRRRHQPVVLTPTDVESLALALPEHLRALADLLSWTGLRIGEARALRRRDVDLRDQTEASVSVAQNVSQGGRGINAVVGRVKTEAGYRTVAIPEELALVLGVHVERFAQPGRDGLLFPGRSGGVLPEGTWRYAWIRAREKAGLPDVRTHDLRHTSLTMAARAGATAAELMHRAGHSEARVAMIYQHAAADRDRMIAERMAAMAREDELAARRERRRLGERDVRSSEPPGRGPGAPPGPDGTPLS
ncbi:site-specific integrase [Cellulomonas sp. PhB143]|uniref:tyrosine-type recombinase/integrase n=1 Tax=Cellulomonas sp. PhB143 TaxID=2485186 RepID=UPI001F2779E7|nr:site-specific integrase [Cellulomonas sp. PhB143]